MNWINISERAPQHRQKVRCKINHHKGEYEIPDYFYYNAEQQVFVAPKGSVNESLGHHSIDAWIDAEEAQSE